MFKLSGKVSGNFLKYYKLLIGLNNDGTLDELHGT